MAIKLFHHDLFYNGTGTSIIEAFLCSGRLPENTATLNSMARENENHNLDDYITFDKKIKGTEFVMKEKIFKLKSIGSGCLLGELSKFEKLSEANGWTDEQMGAIYYSLIEDDMHKYTLCENSYIRLRTELLMIAFPLAESRLLINRMDNLRQLSFSKIDEYFNEVEKLVRIYSTVNNLSKAETDRKLYEIFYKGLAKCTSIEVLKQNISANNYRDILNFLRRIEDGILIQASLEKMQVCSNMQSGPVHSMGTKSPDKVKKWCKFIK